MKYRNKETGVIVEVESLIGGNWEKVEDKKSTKKASTKATKKKEE